MPAEEWDPGGLDLARRLAGELGGSQTPGRRRRRRAENPAAGADRRGSGRTPTYSGPGSDPRDPQPVGEAVDRLVAEHGWQSDIAVAGALARWPAVAGPEVAAHTRAERFADGQLTVVADSTTWATSLRLLAPLIVRRLNEELGHGTVRSVSVVGPTPPSWRRGRRAVRGRGPRDTYG